jgi:hypothetical protein
VRDMEERRPMGSPMRAPMGNPDSPHSAAYVKRIGELEIQVGSLKRELAEKDRQLEVYRKASLPWEVVIL